MTDPNTGWHWTTKWYCGNRGGAYMYLDASYNTKTAIMDSTWSWFVCYRRGVTHAGGNNVWYYSLGDRAVAGMEGHRGWGYMPAVDVWTSTDPWPGMPACPGASSSPPPVTCIHPTIAFYPGSASSGLRYGEVDFHFDACSDVQPTNWTTLVTRNITNGTGSALGFSLTGSTIYTINSGNGYADYQGDIAWEVCTPYVGWPCTSSGTFKIKFHGYTDSGTGMPHVIVASEDIPIGLALFDTP